MLEMWKLIMFGIRPATIKVIIFNHQHLVTWILIFVDLLWKALYIVNKKLRKYTFCFNDNNNYSDKKTFAFMMPKESVSVIPPISRYNQPDLMPVIINGKPTGCRGVWILFLCDCYIFYSLKLLMVSSPQSLQLKNSFLAGGRCMLL